MVSNYSDAGQERWLANAGIDLLRGTGRLAGPRVVEVGGVRHTARDIVIATGAAPFVPPVAGLRELEGIWTNREVTGMKAVPRRLLVLGAGPVGVEMAQAVRRFGGEVALVGGERVLPREPAPLGEALAEVLRRDGIEVVLGARATAARRDGEDYVLVLDDGRELRGDRLLVATGRRPRVAGIGLETVGVEANPDGIAVDAHQRVGEGLWAIGDVTGIWPLTHVGKYQGDVVAANVIGREPREAHYDAVPRVVFTDPQAATVGAPEARFSATAAMAEVPKMETYSRAYAESNGFLTLLSDGERLTGAYALGPEAGEWLQQATLAIRARVPLDVLRDTIQPFPTFSEIYLAALHALHAEIVRARTPEGALPHADDR
ncbi:MAG: dihydrolipoamide dehydrogenase [Conexibacter sp.]|nr:dihydrolipoamide dehydrogenase [Conexibacter sp.]